MQYGALGTILHELFYIAIKSYQDSGVIVWEKPENIPKLSKEVNILKNGNLGLNLLDYSYRELGNNIIPKLKIIEMEKEVVNLPRLKS